MHIKDVFKVFNVNYIVGVGWLSSSRLFYLLAFYLHLLTFMFITK